MMRLRRPEALHIEKKYRENIPRKAVVRCRRCRAGQCDEIAGVKTGKTNNEYSRRCLKLPVTGTGQSASMCCCGAILAGIRSVQRHKPFGQHEPLVGARRTHHFEWDVLFFSACDLHCAWCPLTGPVKVILGQRQRLQERGSKEVHWDKNAAASALCLSCEGCTCASQPA